MWLALILRRIRTARCLERYAPARQNKKPFEMLVKTLLTNSNYLDFGVLIVHFCGWNFFEFLIFCSVR